MRYISTRGEAAARDFVGALLAGLAEDGGLFVPESWPHFSPADWRALRGLPYAELAARLIAPFVGESIPFATLQALCHAAWTDFDHPAVVPLVQLETGLWVQELFHGPTLAFKDLALQLLGALFEHVLAARGERITIVGATSGDTGAAAIAACRGKPHLSVAILHPYGRISEVQRRQMTTVVAENVLNIAIEGSFDDCQDLVKALFNDRAFRIEMRLAAVNSINWARIAAQIPYYVASALALGAPDREVAFAVPTGNFGNVFAAYAARRLGLPIARLVVASNQNDILARFLARNDMSIRPSVQTLAPAMDIQISSNFERLLFELVERNGKATAQIVAEFRKSGRMPVPDYAWHRARLIFHGFRLDDTAILAEIRRVHARAGYLADPHTAIGIAAAEAAPVGHGVPMIALATAHPAKFPDAINQATGTRPPLPARFGDLYEKKEDYVILPNDLAAVQAAIRAKFLGNAA
ncbi:MAG: threonine synthase [Acetobacteraceae bacterium]|nr:threonine synthase [Acetobacteraceae bacterium]